ncbi:MAG: hypothetical protein CVV58_04420 [Tenericutes bacterium HGW-Tenericutes-3]|nr:MAG: hypothetical protein CVV58_04420 [Tenericutes bacterium HGW-Tenericutes-3]
MEKIIQSLKSIYFTEAEARIYVYLIENPGQTVFQISKSLHLSRSSIYSVIEKMKNDGMLLLQFGPKELYYAEDPKVCFEKLSKDYLANIEQIKTDLDKVNVQIERQPYLNLIGYNNIIGKARTLLYEANDEVYINTDLDLNLFDDAFSFLERKGVDVFIFSFQQLDYKRTNVFVYSYGFSPTRKTRLMLSVDLKTVLVSNYSDTQDEWTATFTKNNLMVKIITEHIHHDIYLQKIRDKEGASLFELYPDLVIDSKFEKSAQ